MGTVNSRMVKHPSSVYRQASRYTLDPGESDAIALALEIQAPAILIDENRGRRAAKKQGLATLGTITVLELAAEQGLLDLKAALNALEGTSFHVTRPLIEAALKRDAARRRAEHNQADSGEPPAG
jgi:predicted nucleic acid-binding protein